eukprot:5698917-Ditylum_brightwellii.AAC.1
MGLHQKMTTSFSLVGRLCLHQTNLLLNTLAQSVYTQTKILCKVDIHIDNKGIVKRINNQMLYLYDYPFNTLSPDWDLIAQAATSLQQHGPNMSIKHVKSHQDDDTPADQLNLSARLNIAAD